MKVLYYVPDLGVCNGVASYSMNYYKQLNDKIKFDFLVTNYVDSPYNDVILNHGDKIFCFPQTKNNHKIYKELDKLLKENKYDIIHCHVINRGAYLLKVAKKNNIKVRILHSHTTQNGDTLFKRIIRYPFKISSLKKSNVFFACSKLAGDYLFKKKKYYIINNAVQFLHSINKTQNDTFVIGTIGRFTIQKNPYFILKIIKKLKDMDFNFRFVWVGSGELLDDVVFKSKELGVYSCIDFVGNTDNVLKYYEQMDLFILPSLYEGLPVVGVEAQVLGIRCLFSNTITSEILLNDNAFSLSIGDADAWVNAVQKMSKEENVLIENKAKKIYDLNENSEKLYLLYKELLRNSRDANE